MAVTGIRFRAQEDLVILQVQINTSPSYSYHENRSWRDAKVEDLLEVAEFCKSDTSQAYESINIQLNRLRDDMLNRVIPRYEPSYSVDDLNHLNALNQHQERD